jgi:hypothetical protein
LIYLYIVKIDLTFNSIYVILSLYFGGAVVVYLTNKTDSHDITEKLLKVALNPGADPGFQVRGGRT